MQLIYSWIYETSRHCKSREAELYFSMKQQRMTPAESGCTEAQKDWIRWTTAYHYAFTVAMFYLCYALHIHYKFLFQKKK